VFSIVNEHIDGELFPLIPRFYDNFRSAKVESLWNNYDLYSAFKSMLFKIEDVILTEYVLINSKEALLDTVSPL